MAHCGETPASCQKPPPPPAETPSSPPGGTRPPGRRRCADRCWGLVAATARLGRHAALSSPVVRPSPSSSAWAARSRLAAVPSNSFRQAGPAPSKPVIRVPFNLVFIAFIDVGSVGRPTIKAKQRPGRDVFGTISKLRCSHHHHARWRGRWRIECGFQSRTARTLVFRSPSGTGPKVTSLHLILRVLLPHLDVLFCCCVTQQVEYRATVCERSRGSSPISTPLGQRPSWMFLD